MSKPFNFLLLKFHMAKSNRTANDQKSDIRNKTSSEYKAAQDNRSRQMNKKSN